MKKKLFLVVLSLFLLTGCGNVPKLKNGEEAVVSFKNGAISVDELYNEIKSQYGLQTLVNMIDKYVLETEFKDYKEEALQSANDNIDALKETYGGEDKLLQMIQAYTSYQSIDAYRDVVYLGSLQNKAVEEYAKTLVTDKEINKYYENSVYGDVKVNHILITPSYKKDATEEEKTKANEKAKKKAEEVISKLKKDDKKDVLKTFKKLAKEYSEDDDNKNKGGDLGYINYNTLGSAYDELVSTALSLKDGEFSTKVITTELGYHVIYRVDQKAKAKLDKVKDNIIEELATKKIESDQTVSVDAIQFYHKKYKMEINDSELKKSYTNYMQNLIANAMTSDKDKEKNEN